jgi:hypothetical protein
MTLTNQYVLPYHFCDVTDSLYRPLRPPTTLRSPFPRLGPLFNLPPDRWFTPCQPHIAGLRLYPLIQQRHLSNPRSRYHRGGRYLCRHEPLVYTHHELTHTLKISKARFIFPEQSLIPPMRKAITTVKIPHPASSSLTHQTKLHPLLSQPAPSQVSTLVPSPGIPL